MTAEGGNAATGVDLSLTATYPPDTLWRVYRDGKQVALVQAVGPLSALVRAGRITTTEDCNGDWTVERVGA